MINCVCLLTVMIQALEAAAGPDTEAVWDEIFTEAYPLADLREGGNLKPQHGRPLKRCIAERQEKIKMAVEEYIRQR